VSVKCECVRLILIVLMMVFIPSSVLARKLSVDSGECSDTDVALRSVKSQIFLDVKRHFRAYGVVESRFAKADKDQPHCHVIYSLFTSAGTGRFIEIKRFEWDGDRGQIAGIDLIGLSPSGAKFAADFWWAEGDGEVHRPLIVDLATRHVIDRSLDDGIQKRIHGCDQNEDFVGVTNAGEALFAIPPSTYDDSPECGGKGVWSFNVTTGGIRQVAKHTEDKWR
jgi:hypothetical protein